METIYKSNEHQSETQISGLLAEMTEFVSNPKPGQAQPRLSRKLQKIWDEKLEWEFIDKTEAEEKQEEADALQAIEDAKPEVIAERRKYEIMSELNQIDMKSIRAIRANETDRMAELEAKAATLRGELDSIKNEFPILFEVI